MFRNIRYSKMDPTRRKYEMLKDSVPAGYKMGDNVQGKSLKAGMKVLAYYNSTNEGVDVVEILGVTNNDQKYGKGGVKFQSVKEMMESHNCRTLAQVENVDHFRDENHDDWGYHTYLVVRDLNHNMVESNGEDFGPWYYVFENRWCRGSGAEKLSFVELVKDETPDFKFSGPNRVMIALED